MPNQQQQISSDFDLRTDVGSDNNLSYKRCKIMGKEDFNVSCLDNANN